MGEAGLGLCFLPTTGAGPLHTPACHSKEHDVHVIIAASHNKEQDADVIRAARRGLGAAGSSSEGHDSWE
jgi:hypothetical protein